MGHRQNPVFSVSLSVEERRVTERSGEDAPPHRGAVYDKFDNFDKNDKFMQRLISTLRQWFDLESPQEKYARRCYEAEMEEKR